MKRSPRFACPSSGLSLGALLRNMHRGLWGSVILALAMHSVFSQWRVSNATQQTVKPLTTRFVKRAPRLTKPLELRKRPHPKRRPLRRTMVALKARVDRSAATSVWVLPTIRSLARPRVHLMRQTQFASTAFEPQARSKQLESAREPKAKVDMTLEMMDIEALDTGRYQAMVIQDPADKKNIRGFFHIARVYAQSAAAAESRQDWKGSPFALAEALPHLIDALNKYTQIKADISGTYTFNSDVFLKTPLIFVCSHAGFTLSPSEAENLGKYLSIGGFLYSDTLINNADVNHHSIRHMWVDALESTGRHFERDWRFEMIPNNHGLYHCYFDFDGPPLCHNNYAIQGRGSRHPATFTIPDYLEGVIIAGRMLGIMTRKNYSAAWATWAQHFKIDDTKQLQFGVNVIIFALTQEGSITNRVMDIIH